MCLLGVRCAFQVWRTEHNLNRAPILANLFIRLINNVVANKKRKGLPLVIEVDGTAVADFGENRVSTDRQPLFLGATIVDGFEVIAAEEYTLYKTRVWSKNINAC